MSSKWRRFEVLLPLQFNDGSDVPAELLAEAVLEIVDHFGAASYETHKKSRDIGVTAACSSAITW
jgi:hypothetical protein